MGDSLEATAVLPDVAQAPVEKVVAYIRYGMNGKTLS
jgi:hypothetical protein